MRAVLRAVFWCMAASWAARAAPGGVPLDGAQGVLALGGAGGAVVGGLMVSGALGSHRAAVSRDIGNLEKKLKACEDECEREAARWSKMKTRDQLDEKLSRFGIQMGYPRPDQVVKMTLDGIPAPKQLSVARLRARNQSNESVAMLSAPMAPKTAARPALPSSATSALKIRRKVRR